MVSTFSERIHLLLDQVGDHDIEARLVVDQVYAQNQHQSFWFKHPQGGKAFYLRDPLFGRLNKNMRRIADKLITEEGSEIRDAMIEVAEDLDAGVVEQAPREFGDLENSGHPIVTDDGATIYDRPPRVHRLSREELRAKDRVRELFKFDRVREKP